MKTTLLTLGLTAALVLQTSATVVTWYSGNLNSTLADNSQAGTVFSTAGTSWNGTWSSGSTIDTVSGSVSVLLNISGGYNNDLYGYLVYNDGSNTRTEILINRVSGSASGFGSGNPTTGFVDLQGQGVTLTDAGSTSIHAGVASAGSYTADSTPTLNGTFGNMASGGTWTLFLADVSGGDQSTLVSWGLSISVVPEPVTWALMGFAVVAGLVVGIRQRADLGRLAGRINVWVDAV